MKKIMIIIALILISVSCTPSAATITATETVSLPSSPSATAAAVPPIETGTPLIPVRLPVGYIPNVQFAPLYVAIDKGFFRQEGLEVIIDYNTEVDSVSLVASGELDFAIVSGEQVLLARAQGLPVTYVLDWYKKYPVAIASLASSNIFQPADLQGKRIGTPALYGASYIGLVVLLQAGGLSTTDVQLDTIGYTQVESLTEGLDDAVVVYSANEPVQLRSLGYEINLLQVSDYLGLVGNGLITNETTLDANPDLVRRMTSGLVQGIQYTIAHPDEAYQICLRYVENLAQADQQMQRQVLDTSIALWQDAHPAGYSDPAAWQNMQDVLLAMGLLSAPLDLQQAFTNEYLP
jgi:NitT/TauT family transport system substrate-binding protein